MRQFLHADPVALSCLVSSGGDATAAAIDPVGEIELYRAASNAVGMHIHYVVETIGFERRHNEGFRIDDQEAFVRFMQDDVPPPPPHEVEWRKINAGFGLT